MIGEQEANLEHRAPGEKEEVDGFLQRMALVN